MSIEKYRVNFNIINTIFNARKTFGGCLRFCYNRPSGIEDQPDFKEDQMEDEINPLLTQEDCRENLEMQQIAEK